MSFSASAGVSMKTSMTRRAPKVTEKIKARLCLGARSVFLWPPPHAPDRRRPVQPHPARSAHLGHRPLQFPLPLLHAEGGVRRGLFVPARPAIDDARRTHAYRPRLSRARSRKSAPH